MPVAKNWCLLPELSRRRGRVDVSGALAAVLRRLGLVGDVAPPDELLVRVAEAFVNDNKVVAASDGRVYGTGGEVVVTVTSPPCKALDDDLPF